MKTRFVVLALVATSTFLGLASAQARQGGGYTLAGPLGEYFANPGFTAPAGFTRRDARIDFGENSLPPGGAGVYGDAPFRSVPASNFSVRWTGQLRPRFSETYTLRAVTSGPLQLRLRPAGSGAWSSVIDTAAPTTNATGTFTFTVGIATEFELSFAHTTGPWTVRLFWSSPSTPEEVIDPLAQSGINNPDWSAGFTDILKGARNSWEGVNSGPKPAMDPDGWPLGDGAYVFQESLNQGLDVDPLMRGRVTFSFRGKATVSLQGNVQSGSLVQSYNAASNVTTGSFVVTHRGWNASYFRFASSDRDGQPGGLAGITDLHLMRPTAPDATTSHAPEATLFTPQLLDAMSHFTVIRHQYVANQQRDWSERTPPSFFNQAGGTRSQPHYGVGDPSDNGASWEHKILLANESGRDLMISIPTVASGRTAADTDSYLVKLANLLRYGSDGVEPYTSPVPNPVYPPLNPNLRVYLELENELWNWASVFYTDFGNVNALTTADADANNADFQAINFDVLPTTKDGNGNYTSLNTWRYRSIVLRLVQMSDIFRAVFGDDAMMSRIRPLYAWQYDNANDTARLGLTFADRYLNNGDGQNHVAEPHPISHWLWGGSGASYYGAVNGNGLTTLLVNPTFAEPVLPVTGYTPTPADATWTFTGTAGIARDGGSGDDIPPAWQGSQMGYLTDRGQASFTVTFPTNFTSPIFAVSFKALNRQKTGASSADRQNLRVFLDGTNDITARTFSQGNGYTPSAYDAANPWTANNVFWTRSEYYATRSFSVQPGSTHTITFRGMGDLNNAAATDQTAFLGEARVTSVDRIFEDGMPGGGEATGQPTGQNIRRVINTEAAWAKAFGLEQICYESGWSLGGDDGGSWLQLRAKYGDARTAGVQGTFMDYFHRSGSAVNVFGTYAQWPSWADFYAEQGLLNVAAYPILQGIDHRASTLPPEPDNGTLIPALLGAAQATLSDRANAALGRIDSAGGWIAWNLIAPRSGAYGVTANTTGSSGNVILLLDDALLASATAGATFSSTNWITKGFHSLKIRSTSGSAVTLQRLTVFGDGAPPSPTILSAADGNGSATLTWSAATGATNYVVRYGPASSVYTNTLNAGLATHLTVAGLANNHSTFFVVLAENAQGLSLPSAERGVVPLAPGQTGGLATWEFTGYAGNEATAPASAASAKLTLTPLRRGAGVNPSSSSWAATLRVNRFASEANAYGTNLASAITRNQYYQFTLTPTPGHTVSLAELAFRAFFQNDAGGASLTWSTNGTQFTPQPAASGSPSSSSTPWKIDLASILALQDCSNPITLRIYLFGSGPYTITALGDASGEDLLLTGSFQINPVRLSITRPTENTLALAWPTNSAPLIVGSSPTVVAPLPWAPVPELAELAGDHWQIVLPVGPGNRFFLLAQ